jgi:hypothetical protein
MTSSVVANLKTDMLVFSWGVYEGFGTDFLWFETVMNVVG